MYTSGVRKAGTEEKFAHIVPAKMLSNIYLNFSNYVHGRYPEAMDLHGGEPPRFHFRGMGGTPKDNENVAMLGATIESVSITFRVLVQKLGLQNLVEAKKDLSDWFSNKQPFAPLV
jgi:hypothetical protein